jgi:hypothetical protein
MPDYSKSKIYKLTSSNSNDIYIGSTTLKLANRKAHHISNYKRYLINKGNYITSIKIIEYGGDIDICLLEEYPCNNKEQLHQRERFYIENNCCVNKYIPLRKINKDEKKIYDKEYCELNKDKIKIIDAKYRELNREKAKAYRELNKDKQKEYNKKYRIKQKLKKEQKMNNMMD